MDSEPFLLGAYNAEEARLCKDETEEPSAYRERQNARIGKMLMEERTVMQNGVPIYGRGRFPKLRKDENGKNLCRGCGGAITDSRRQTWCSEKCHELFDPRYVRMAVIKRDNHVCQVCKTDIMEAVKRWRASRPQGRYTWDEFCKWSGVKPIEEYHHLVEFADGGLTTVDNMITICVPCHRKLTAEYAKKRAKQRKENGK